MPDRRLVTNVGDSRLGTFDHGYHMGACEGG